MKCNTFPKMGDAVKDLIRSGHYAMYRKKDGGACLVVPAGKQCCPGAKDTLYYDIAEDGTYGEPYKASPEFVEVIRL